MKHLTYYKEYRRKGFIPESALYYAKVKSEYEELQDHILIEVVPDNDCDIEDLFGDVYNPEANPDIPREQLEAERQKEIERIEREGVFGIIGEYLDSSNNWIQADSIYGFIGDDWVDSGYDIDVIASAIEEFRRHYENIDACRNCPHRKGA